MQFSNLALAAFITVGVQAACPPKGFHGIKPSLALSIPSYSFSGFALPTTLSSVITPASAPVVVVATSASSAAVATTSSVVEIPTTTAVASSSAVATSTTSAAAATSSAASSDASLTADQSSALSTQNDARSAVGEDALTWDADLASDAQTWADHLATLTAGTLTHDDQSAEGENLYWSSDATNPFEAAAEAWVAEKSSYSGEAISTGGNFEEYGHYTQIIWKTTTHVGMAVADDGQGGVYVVARYSPPGNYIGETPTEATS